MESGSIELSRSNSVSLNQFDFLIVFVVTFGGTIGNNKAVVFGNPPTTPAGNTTGGDDVLKEARYDIQCNAVQWAPTVRLSDCKIVPLNDAAAFGQPLLITDIGNVKITAPFNVNERAHIQSNPFAKEIAIGAKRITLKLH